MSDTTHEAPERIWAWGWRDSSGWQEQTWQHEDEPMSTMEYVRADLVEAAEQRGYASAMEAERKLHEDRIAALTEQLAAARGDAEEAEAYAGWSEAKLAECEARLGKAVEEAFFEGFCEGRDGDWVWGDPTPAW